MIELRFALFLFLLVLSQGCVLPQECDKIGPGDLVWLEYRGWTDFQEESEVVDDNMLFIAGEGQVLQGLEDEVIGMCRGDEKRFRLPPEKAFGLRNENLVIEVPIELIEDAEGIHPGAFVEVREEKRIGLVIDVRQSTLIVDFNPVFAGEHINYWVKVVNFKEKEDWNA